MESNELRVRNWVYSEETQSDVQWFEGNFLNTALDSIKPILLTKEWLTKFSYNWKEEKSFPQNAYWENKLSAIDFDKKRFYIKRYKANDNHADVNLPEYVHELQNLYFALTKKELEIT